MEHTIKHKIAEILDPHHKDTFLARGFNIFIITLIILNVFAVTLETVESLGKTHSQFFKIFKIISVMVFTIEYILRLWTSNLHHRYQDPIKGRLRYAMSPMALIDLLAIIPFYLPMFPDTDLRFIRVLRLSRLFTLLKMVRYSKSLGLMANAISEKKEELLIVFAGVMALLMLSSGFIYFLENEIQPEAFSSIPAAMWWGVATMTTVGYGDIYPITPIGKFFGGVVAILGVGTFGLPTGIIAYGFIEEIQKRRFHPSQCPHCGEKITFPVNRRAS